MKPLSLLAPDAARALGGVIFDLDDTVLDHGALTEAAYGALFRLRETGLALIACTGRPAGWGEVIQRQWPIDATIVENGAVALVREQEGDVAGHRQGHAARSGASRVVTIDGLDRDTRRARRASPRVAVQAVGPSSSRSRMTWCVVFRRQRSRTTTSRG
jgi:hypothetical protein